MNSMSAEPGETFLPPELDHCTTSEEHKNTGGVICDKKEKPGLDHPDLDSNLYLALMDSEALSKSYNITILGFLICEMGN